MKRNEPVSHIMTKNPKTVHVGQKLSEVREILMDGGFHHMPVVSGKKLVGIISATDILRVSYEYDTDGRATGAVLDNTRTISDVMQSEPMTLAAKASIRSAAEVFSKNWFHALPVVEDDELVGIITTTDMMHYLLDQY